MSMRIFLRPAAAIPCLLLLAVLSCDDREPTVTSPLEGLPGPRAAIDDGAHEGNPDFFFLPPLVPDPSTDPDLESIFDEGAFNGDLSPLVRICELAGDPAEGSTDCADPQPSGFPLEFTMGGSGSASIRVDHLEEQYVVNWHTDESGLDTDKFYRIRVFASPLSGSSLGFADFQPLSTGKELKNVDTGEFIALKDGRTLPVKFRIEDGALCDRTEPDLDCSDAGSGVVGPNGGTVVTNTGFAGVSVPEGAVDDEILITVARRELEQGERCLPTGLVQAEGCYRFDTEPDLDEVNQQDEFNVPVTVGVCLELDADRDRFLLHKFDPENAQQGVVALDEAQAPFIDCTDFALLDADRGWLGELATTGWERLVQPAASWLGPWPLAAADLGLGGTTLQFSDIGWAEPVTLSIADGDGQTEPVNSTLPLNPSVLVQRTHTSSPEPAPGVDVTFTVTGGGGSVGQAVVTADPNGIAETSWTLGSLIGNQTLRASIEGIPDADVSFTAEATAVGPDLALAVSHDPAQPSFTEAITFRAEVTNIGSGTAGPSTTRLELVTPDVTRTVDLSTPSLAPGASFTHEPFSGPFSEGAARVSATADLNDDVAETDENNNFAAGPGFQIVPLIDFEHLGDGTDVNTLSLPLDLDDEYARQDVQFSFVDSNGDPGVASLCDSQAMDPVGVSGNHSATVAGSGDPCAGWTNGEITVTLTTPANSVQMQLRGNDDVDPFPVEAFDTQNSQISVQRSNIANYTSNNGFGARQETVTFSCPTTSNCLARIVFPTTPVIVAIDEFLIERN